MSNYHLTYIGADGIIFDSIQPGHSIDPKSVNLRLSKGHALFALKDLPSGPFGPPQRVWTYGLPLFFPGTHIDVATGEIEVPITSLLGPFIYHPAAKPTVQAILRRHSPWLSIAELSYRAANFRDGPPIHHLVEEWIVERDVKWAAGAARRSVRTTPYLCWEFVDLIALANWAKVGIECRIDTILFALVMALNEISPSEAEFLAGFDADGLIESRATAFYNYLSDRSYDGIALGPLSNEEKLTILGGLEEPDPRPDPPGFVSLAESTLRCGADES